MTVTITDMRDFLIEQAAADPNKVSECTYAVPDYDSPTNEYGDFTVAYPMCIVGCVMVKDFGVSPLQLLNTGMSAMDVLPSETGQEFTTDALLLAQVAQRLQDGTQGRDGMRWQDAVNYAITSVFAIVATWKDKVYTVADIRDVGPDGRDLASHVVEGIYRAYDIPQQF
jgi:hypothetical protein